MSVRVYRGVGQYTRSIKSCEEDSQKILKNVNELSGEQPLQVARCTKIINADSDDAKYIINVKQFAKFVVDLGDQVAPTDIEEGMRVGVDRNKYQIHIPLPPKIDPTVTMMQVEEKPDVTYSDVGGCKEQIEKLREVVEDPLLHETEIRSVCTEAGMFAIRARRKMATEKDFLDAVNKVIKAYAKFQAPLLANMTYN
nr:hypothetical protein BaRGS_005190 [Batillaria attramentaria]